MAQNRIPRGNHGDITLRAQPNGRWLARVQVRDIDGRVRSVRASGASKGEAKRTLESKLAVRSDPSVRDISSAITFEELATRWLQYRKDHGKVRSNGPLAKQTLAVYTSEVTNVINPAIGAVQIKEASVPMLDRLFADVEAGRDHGTYKGAEGGRSTRQLRVVLGGMLALAVAHGALPANPIRDAAKSSREDRHEVQYLTIEQAILLRRQVARINRRVPGERMPSRDLEELIDVLLGTGCRVGEGLAIRPIDLADLDGERPTVHICGTIVEPRGGFVDHLHRQSMTKTREDRTLIIPARVVEVLQARMQRNSTDDPTTPIFATRGGNPLSPSNMRSRLREALTRPSAVSSIEPELVGTTFHTLRRTVGTLIAHEVSLDAARDQLGHRDGSVTYQHYVGRRLIAPDLRPYLDLLLAPWDRPTPSKRVANVSLGHLTLISGHAETAPD